MIYLNKENTEKLIKDFPRLFRGINMSIRENLMSFGFMCGDGWFNLIYNLCKNIQIELNKDKNLEEDVYAVEVKEKFGGLRFYITCGNDRVFDLIQKAEEESNKTCEVCGSNGSLSVSGRRYQTLCEKHRKESGGKIVE